MAKLMSIVMLLILFIFFFGSNASSASFRKPKSSLSKVTRMSIMYKEARTTSTVTTAPKRHLRPDEEEDEYTDDSSALSELEFQEAVAKCKETKGCSTGPEREVINCPEECNACIDDPEIEGGKQCSIIPPIAEAVYGQVLKLCFLTRGCTVDDKGIPVGCPPHCRGCNILADLTTECSDEIIIPGMNNNGE